MSLERRFAARARRYLPARGPLVVGVSGGLDSTVLLHLLRFHVRRAPGELVVAHFDHRMRPDSGSDADWVRGLALAWGCECQMDVAMEPPTNEAEARRARYRFLEHVRARVEAEVLLTAHHADDQAETVLFRALRGTGVRGLRGIPSTSPDGRVRLLLPFWREEVAAYARAVRVSWRTDPTNSDLGRARNALRHQLLPRAEALIAPGARRALVRLARNAAREEAAWDAITDDLLEPVVLERGPERFLLDRSALLAYDAAIRLRLVRTLARRLGSNLDEAGTRVAMEFTSRGASGAGVGLGESLTYRRSFETLEVAKVPRVAASQTPGRRPDAVDFAIASPEPGSGSIGLGARRLQVRWGGERHVGAATTAQTAFAARELTFPLVLRGWRPGDCMRLAYGTKKVAKLLAEAKVPRWKRPTTAVLVDGDGRSLWIPGVARSADAVPGPGRTEFHIGVDDADSS